MATVTQLSSGTMSSGTSLALTGVSVIPGDLLCVFIGTYANLGVSSFSNLGNVILSNNLGLNNFNSSPDLWSDNWYGIQTATVSNQTINLNVSSSWPTVAIVFRIRPDTGNQLVVKSRSYLLDDTAINYVRTGNVSPQRGSIVIGGCAVSNNTSFTDSDTTGGSWSSVFYSDSTASYDIAVFGQTKIMTSTGTFKYDGNMPVAAYALPYVLEVVEQGKPYWGMLTR